MVRNFLVTMMLKVVTFLFIANTIFGSPIETKALEARDASPSTTTLTTAVWTTTVETSTTVITPYAFDGVTVSASPISSSATNWVSLDSSGIPYKVLPTVKDGSTLSASPTPTNSYYPTPLAAPPVLRCMNERITSGSSICISNNTEFVVGETYWITWNPLYWDSSNSKSTILKVKLKLREYSTGDSETNVATSDWIDNSDGSYPWTFTSSDMTDSGNEVQIVITPFITDGTDADVVSSILGPYVKIIASKSDSLTTITRVPSDNADQTSASSSSTPSSTSKGKSNKAKVIVPAIIVPIVVIALIAAAVFYYLWKKRAGYVGSRQQRTGEAYQLEKIPLSPKPPSGSPFELEADRN